MAEYIEREALLNSKHWNSLKDEFEVARAKAIIICQPNADVQEVKHGSWERTGIVTCRCSICHHEPIENSGGYLALTPCCPFCGAKMDEGVLDNEETKES